MAFESILDKVSELAQTGVAKAKELTDVGVAKTKELAEISRLKMENVSEQESIKKAYLEIGKLYFAERGMAPEAPYSALCEKIAAAKAKIEYNQERIADIKAAGDVNDADLDLVEGEVIDVEETETFADLVEEAVDEVKETVEDVVEEIEEKLD